VEGDDHGEAYTTSLRVVGVSHVIGAFHPLYRCEFALVDRYVA